MWTGNVPEYLTHLNLSTCRVFRDILIQGPQNLQNIQDNNKMERDDSIWTTSDISAYHKACTCGDMQLTLLSNGRLVSSTMLQNPDPHCTPQSLPPDGGIMGDYKPNVTIRDTFDTSNVVMLLSQGDGSFDIDHLLVD